jgi:ribosomal protein L16 Arg81 hydroxylase
MTGTDLELSSLLAPTGADQFFRDYWEKEALFIDREDPSCYAGILTSADIDAVIAFTRPKCVDPAAFSREPPRARTYVQGWLAERPAPEAVSYPSASDFRRAYDEGKTVVLMTMQQRWLPVAALCRNLEAVFHCPVHANLYLTPPGAQGFDAHFDPHEVFVLQMEGAKHWRLYGPPPRELPLADERFDTPRDRLGTPRDVHLKPGDLLYVPRGHVHEAFTADGPSLHLTVGVNVYRWVDLLHEALDALSRRDVRFRRSLPPGLLDGRPPGAEVSARVRNLLATLAERVDSAEAVARLGDHFFGQLPVMPRNLFGPPESSDEVELDTVLEKAPGVICRVVEEGGWVGVEVPGGRFGGPAKILPALRFLAGSGRFAVRELPDGLGDEGKRVLARRLLRERLLRVTGRQAPSDDGADVPAGASRAVGGAMTAGL